MMLWYFNQKYYSDDCWSTFRCYFYNGTELFLDDLVRRLELNKIVRKSFFWPKLNITHRALPRWYFNVERVHSNNSFIKQQHAFVSSLSLLRPAESMAASCLLAGQDFDFDPTDSNTSFKNSNGMLTLKMMIATTSLSATMPQSLKPSPWLQKASCWCQN